jgi:hypothetical protein
MHYFEWMAEPAYGMAAQMQDDDDCHQREERERGEELPMKSFRKIEAVNGVECLHIPGLWIPVFRLREAPEYKALYQEYLKLEASNEANNAT